MEHDLPFSARYSLLMLSEWLRDALESAGKSQSDLARVLTAQLGRSIDRAAVNKMTKGTRDIAADELLETARYLGVPTPGGTKRRIKLSGYVGAAQTVYQFDEDGAGYVEAPPESSPETTAVEVRGDSMLPLYREGAVLYYSKQLDPVTQLGQMCVVRLEDERVLVKTVRRGSAPGLYTLDSLNAPSIDDVALQWAAPIDWIKPR